MHGKGSMKYDNVRIGVNSRLDTLQAAILQVKLKAFQEYELRAVQQVADWYDAALAQSGWVLPYRPQNFTSSWAQYTIQLPQSVDRNALQKQLKEKGIPTMVYYPKAMHTQQAFMGTDSAEADCPVTKRLCNSVLSLPIGPYLCEEDVDMISKYLNGIK